MDELIKVIENEKNNRFNKSWTKLDKGCKLNRLVIFIKNEKEQNNLSDNESKKLKKMLFHLCENGSINKVGDVEYDETNEKIISIKNLKYEENKLLADKKTEIIDIEINIEKNIQDKKSVDKIYSFNVPKKIIKPSSKSKSNIDRHFSRSKENKR